MQEWSASSEMLFSDVLGNGRKKERQETILNEMLMEIKASICKSKRNHEQPKSAWFSEIKLELLFQEAKLCRHHSLFKTRFQSKQLVQDVKPGLKGCLFWETEIMQLSWSTLHSVRQPGISQEEYLSYTVCQFLKGLNTYPILHLRNYRLHVLTECLVDGIPSASFSPETSSPERFWNLLTRFQRILFLTTPTSY